MSESSIIGRVVSVHVGRVAPLGPEAEPSGFVKHAVAGPVAVDRLGLAGDEQADLRVHGGPDKAVYAYAVSHLRPGRRNFLSTRRCSCRAGWGRTWRSLAWSRRTSARATCMRLAARCCSMPAATALLQIRVALQNNSLPKAMVRSGRSGWYYRVLQTGTVAAGDTVMLHARPNPDFPFVRLLAVINHGDASIEELARMADMPGLADQLQAHARKLLQQGPEHSVTRRAPRLSSRPSAARRCSSPRHDQFDQSEHVLRSGRHPVGRQVHASDETAGRRVERKLQPVTDDLRAADDILVRSLTPRSGHNARISSMPPTCCPASARKSVTSSWTSDRGTRASGTQPVALKAAALQRSKAADLVASSGRFLAFL